MATRVLVVDDDQSLAKILLRRLEAEGYEVENVSDGFSALEKVRRERPQLIILDILLPEVDGYKVCRILKLDATSKDIPVIILTVRTQEEDRKKGLEMGADAYMGKPYEDQELLSMIEKLLGKRSGS
jgi:DNA-binding response OmpR family regulator